MALIASKTRTALELIDGHTFVIKAVFPNGATADVTYHLFRGTGPTPGHEPAVKGAAQGGQYRFTYQYVVPGSSLPTELRGQLAGLPTAAPASFDTRATSSGGPVVQLAGYRAEDPQSNLSVAVNGVVSQSTDLSKESMAKILGQDTGEHAVSMIENGAKIWDAFAAGAEVNDSLDKQNAFKDCAENPTNPLTIDQYAKDPTAKQKIVDQVDGAKADIMESAVALGVATAIDMGSGKLGDLPKGPLAVLGVIAGYVVTIGTDVVKKNLQAVVSAALSDSEAAVTPCHPTYVASGGLGSVVVSGVVSDITKPFTLKVSSPGASGVVTFVPSNAFLGTIDGKSTSAAGVEISTGTYQLTKTPSGYTSTGSVKTCLPYSCSTVGNFRVTFTEQKRK